MGKKRVSVQIDGRSYVVITEDDEAYVKEIAERVSESLLRASRSGKNLDVRDCAILVALDFCDDSMKEKRHNKDLIEKADQIMQHTNEMNKKCSDFRERLIDAINENTRLTKRIRALEDQLRVLARDNERLKKFEPRKDDAEKQFEKTLQERRAEKLMGYVPMEQGSLFDGMEPEEPQNGKEKPVLSTTTQKHGKKKKKHGKN